MNRRLLRTASFLALASSALAAQAAIFDFESSPYGSYTSLSATDAGLTLTLTRQGGASFNVSDYSGVGAPASFGTHLVEPFTSIEFASSFIGNFSSAIGGIRMDVGDFGQDSDLLTLSLYSGLDGTGTLLGSVNGSLAGGGVAFSYISLTTSGNGARSFVLSGDPQNTYPVSIAFDNITTEGIASVPGPLAAVPFALMALKRRKRA